jgi:hypothetical protein
MAEDPPQQPVERHQEAVLGSGESRRGLDSMMVAPPVPAAQLPDAAQPQANVSGNGASTQGNAMDAAPVDYDG